MRTQPLWSGVCTGCGYRCGRNHNLWMNHTPVTTTSRAYAGWRHDATDDGDQSSSLLAGPSRPRPGPEQPTRSATRKSHSARPDAAGPVGFTAAQAMRHRGRDGMRQAPVWRAPRACAAAEPADVRPTPTLPALDCGCAPAGTHPWLTPAGRCRPRPRWHPDTATAHVGLARPSQARPVPTPGLQGSAARLSVSRRPPTSPGQTGL